MRRLNIIAVIFWLVCGTLTAQAGPRAERWSGFDIGVGVPFPSIVGVLAGFNIGDDARVGIGTGLFGPWAVYQLDGKFFFSPTAWSGYTGAGIDYMTGRNGKALIWTLPFDRAFVPYIEGGADFQSDIGVHVSFNLAGSAPSSRVLVVPGVAIGWYF